jgi:hypothetical protein
MNKIKGSNNNLKSYSNKMLSGKKNREWLIINYPAIPDFKK